MQLKNAFKSFPPTYWIVILFEFFERGSYYGMMSFLSVYLTNNLGFAKTSVGVIKGTIQPLLYFLPIISGALADRFGYRRTVMVAFALLGTGYFLTSQMTTYTAVFLSLVVMGLGAGTFKPIISGTIARSTTPENSSLGFGIFYWSINLGAFLFPLILVPWLKNSDFFGPKWVIIASALCTGSMIIPAIFLYKEPPKPEITKSTGTSLFQTLANAFEIIYSPFVLAYQTIKNGLKNQVLYSIIFIVALSGGIYLFHQKSIALGIFVVLLFASSQLIMRFQNQFHHAAVSGKTIMTVTVLLIGVVIWILPGISTFARFIMSIIYLTVFSLFLIKFDDASKFRDHSHFLLMIFLYSGFWVLYFQMFDSVLWYVNDYVDATSIDRFVNSLFAGKINFKFDVEHVTVINAGTIILLQILISNIVKNTKALPTMISGIAIATVGMAILAISSNIWVFMTGIFFFSIGEMTAHPKFFSYVGLIAPKDRVATYMGYISLYGVIGSSIGAIVGANLYVHFVDKLHQPRLLWLIFSGIGVATIIGLLLYNQLIGTKEK
jgi:dipeptide/tripeptide permease